MNRSIWKFPLEIESDTSRPLGLPLEIESDTEVMVPVGAEIVHAEVQNENPVLWAVVDPQEQLELRTFRIVGTGHYFDHALRYVGTVHIEPFVWHIMEV